ncbi:hypothetical protein ACFQAT_11570 [Undibacterium arcticum]|uniref:Uncharacterized protein n=1 Tax=Undibacterium arcticum TaxID=1762892 RepID=A0ABV7F978_9BURK
MSKADAVKVASALNAGETELFSPTEQSCAVVASPEFEYFPSKSKYLVHPSPELNALFAHKPYQGAAPERARFLFIGLDANYDAEIETKPIFSKVREYHDDGVAFWRKHGVHHPFLLPEYSGDGRRYHQSFSRIGFGPEHADLVSFIELLHVPTVGRNILAANNLDATHLNMLNAAILGGNPTHIFIPRSVAGLMRATGVFPWLAKVPQEQAGSLDLLFRTGTKTVYSHLHFSAYGKFTQRKAQEATAIRALLPRFS